MRIALGRGAHICQALMPLSKTGRADAMANAGIMIVLGLAGAAEVDEMPPEAMMGAADELRARSLRPALAILSTITEGHRERT